MVKAEDLLVLLEVSRCGTLVGAARILGIDHSTASRRLDSLERELGTPVLVRSGNETRLTRRGESLLEASQLVEEALALAQEKVHAPDGAHELTGLLRVSSSDAFGVKFAAPVLARLQGQHPSLAVELATSMRQVGEKADADIEIGVRTARFPDSTTISPYTLGLYASEGYLSRHGAPASLEAVAQHPAVFYIEPLMRLAALNTLGSLLPNAQVKFGSTNVFAHLAATVAGAGLGLLPCFLADAEDSLVRVLPESISVKFTFYARVSKRAASRPAAGLFIGGLLNEVNARRAELLGRYESDKLATSNGVAANSYTS